MHNRTLVGISYRLPDGRGGYLPLRHPGGGNLPVEGAREWARQELRGKQIVCANAKHEADTLLRFGADLEEQGCRMRDVFHQAALLNDHRHRCNLTILTEEELPGYRRIEARHELIHQMPVAEAAPIAVEDADLAWRLNEIYEPRIEAEGLEAILRLEDDLVYATAEMERNGAYLDVPLLLAWEREVAAEWERRILALHRSTGLRVDPNSWQSMTELFAHKRLRHPYTPPTEAHPDGCPSFTEEFLATIEDPDVRLALEARQLSSLLSKYLTKYRKAVAPDGLIRYALHQLRGDEWGTITGRYSSSRPNRGMATSGINVQQVSVKEKQPLLTRRWPIRRLFVPPPRRVWVSADASQIEFRLFAHYAARRGWTRLALAYARDPKTDFHALIVRWTGLNRGFAKNVSFAKLYGGGIDKIAAMCRVSREEGERLVRQYNREFPEAGCLLKLASDQAETVGYVRTHDGRRRRYTQETKFYSALNSVLQGTAADIMKRKLLELYRERRRLGLTLRFTVHDEVDGDLPDAGALAAVQELLDRQTTPLMVPILWEARTGTDWEGAH